MDTILQFLSEYSTSLSYDRLSRETVHQAKRRLIDTLGCATGAYPTEPARIARAHALETMSTPGAIVLGTGHRTTPELAAFANGVMARYLELNDTSLTKDSGHPSDNIPAVLAVAEYAGVDARRAITGITLAYEVMDRLGNVCGFVERGWDNVAYVALATAAGAGNVLGLTQGQMANALAMTAVANVALRQTRVGELSMWKGCAAAYAARNGVFAALMARRGLTGPQEAFSGPKGFLKQLTSGNVQLPSFGGNGQPFMIELSGFKLFPSDYHTQCAVNSAVELHQLLGKQVNEIEKVIVYTYDFAIKVTADTRDKWNPTSRETADHSLPYIVAVALTNGTVWLDDLSEERIKDSNLYNLMQKIEVRLDDEYTRAYPEAYPCRIEVTTRSGNRHVRETQYAKGQPKNPMSDKEIEEKFRRLAEPVLEPGQTSQILERLWHLDEVRDLGELLTLFVS